MPMIRYLHIVAFAILFASLSISRVAQASCEPGTLKKGTHNCECPAGYENQTVAGDPRCIKVTVDAKPTGATATTLPTTTCKVGDIDDCKKKCDSNGYAACVVLGQMYRTAKGVSLADPVKAYELFKKGCGGGELNGCVEQGRMAETGVGTKKDLDVANKAYAQACDGSHALGCREMASNYQSGDGVKKDVAKATELFEKACTLNDYPSCTIAGYSYTKGLGVSVDTAKGIKLWTLGCDGAQATSCWNLAISYGGSDVKTKDMAKAVLYLGKACTLKHAEACTELGHQYAQGGGVTADPAKAYFYFDKACSAGESDGCNQAALALLNGRGVAKDEKAAAARFDKACKGKQYDACGSLGEMYVKGVGVNRDEKKGAPLIQLACDEGENALACEFYAQLVQEGRGVTKDEEVALDYGDRACELEPGRACLWTGNLLLKLYPNDKKERAYARRVFEEGCAAKHDASCKAIEKLNAVEEAKRKAIEAENERKIAPAWITLPGFGVKIQMAGGADFTATATTNYRKRPVTVLERKKDTGNTFRISIARETLPCGELKPLPNGEKTETSPNYLPEEATLRNFYHPVGYEGVSADGLRYAFVCADMKDGSAFHLTLIYRGQTSDELFIVTTRSLLASFARAMIDYPPAQFEFLDDQGKLRTWRSYVVRSNVEIGGAYFQPRTLEQKDFALLAMTGGMTYSSALVKKVGVGFVGGFEGSFLTILGVTADTHLAAGLGLKAGPLHLAPLVGGGVDGAFVLNNDFKVPVAPYYFFGGDLRLRLGLASLGAKIMFPRRADDLMVAEQRYAVTFAYKEFSMTGQYWQYETPNPANVPRALMLTIGSRYNAF
jgi:TPR repeat protein